MHKWEYIAMVTTAGVGPDFRLQLCCTSAENNVRNLLDQRSDDRWVMFFDLKDHRYSHISHKLYYRDNMKICDNFLFIRLGVEWQVAANDIIAFQWVPKLPFLRIAALILYFTRGVLFPFLQMPIRKISPKLENRNMNAIWRVVEMRGKNCCL